MSLRAELLEAFKSGFKQAFIDYFAPFVWLKKKLVKTRFIKLDDAVISREAISEIDTARIEELILYVYTKSGACYLATDLNAIELLMQIYPAAFEGCRLKYYKFMWLIHNLIGHPIMQLLAMIRCYNLAFWVHNVTAPKPLGKK